MQLIDDLYGLRDKVARSYLLVTPKGLILIDTGLPGNAGTIEKHVKKLGRKLSDIRHILITHSDSDHYGSLRVLQGKTSAKTYASAVEAKAIRLGKSSRELKFKGIAKVFYRLLSRLFRAKPAKVDVILRPGDTLPLWGGITVLDTQGHTPGHISFYSKKHSVLFAGDSILIHGGKLVPANGANTWDGERALKSFNEQLKLEPKYICGGHGWKEMA